MKKYIIIFFLILISISCNKKNRINDPLELFNDLQNLEYNDIIISGKQIGRPAGIDVISDTLLIVFDPQEKYLYDLFNLNTSGLICRFGRIGRGPGEFGVPTLLSKCPYNPRKIGIYDRRNFEFAELSVDSILKNNNYLPPFKYNGFDKRHYQLYSYKKNQFLGLGYFDKRYVISNKSGEIVKKMHHYPFQQELGKYKNDYVSFVYQGKMAFHNHGNRFVYACRNSPNFEICTIEDTSITEAIERNFQVPKFKPVAGLITVDYLNNNLFGFIDITVSDKFIYLLYSGKNKATDNESDINISNKILVFDWDANPIKIYETNIDLNMIEIIKDKILLGINGQAAPNVYEFRL